MTYQDLIDNIRDLGFSDDEEMEEFAETGLLYTAIDRAITRINLEFAPIIERYEFEITDSDTEYMYIDMTDVDENFLDFADTAVLIEKGGVGKYAKFSNYDIEADNTLVINADENKGKFRVFYKAQHEKFTGAQRREELPVPLKAHHIVALLAAYYVWLDDDPTKAAQYYNMFETERDTMLLESQTNKIKVRVLPGGM